MAVATAVARRARGRAALVPVLVFTVTALVSFTSLLVAGVNRADEVWNLHVIDQMLNGDVLYRDIRYFPTPLGPFLGLGAVALFGSKLLVLKALIAVSFGITATANLLIMRTLGVGRRARILLVVALLLFALPPASSLYNTLVITFVSTTALLALRWEHALRDLRGGRRPRRLLALAAGVGVSAGACALTKYNIGAVVILAVAGSFSVPLLQGRIRGADVVSSALTAAGAFLVTVLAGLLPVLLQGAGDDFVRQLLDGSSLLDAPVSYQDGWDRLLAGVRAFTAPEMRSFAAYAILPLSVLAGAVAAARSTPVARAPLIMLGLFSLASAVLAVPRADHVVWAVPIPLALLLGSAAEALRGWSTARPAAAEAVRATCLGFAVTWLVLALVNEGRAARGFERVDAGHFEGALLPAGQWRGVTKDVAELGKRIGSDRKVLILSLDAGFYYLAGNFRNPTPYDYPDSFEFGSRGVDVVRAALVNYSINYTCISRSYPRELEPAAVIGTVQARARLVARLAMCDLWQTAPTGPLRWP